jgi:hypothetical protein
VQPAKELRERQWKQWRLQIIDTERTRATGARTALLSVSDALQTQFSRIIPSTREFEAGKQQHCFIAEQNSDCFGFKTSQYQ